MQSESSTWVFRLRPSRRVDFEIVEENLDPMKLSPCLSIIYPQLKVFAFLTTSFITSSQDDLDLIWSKFFRRKRSISPYSLKLKLNVNHRFNSFHLKMLTFIGRSIKPNRTVCFPPNPTRFISTMENLRRSSNSIWKIEVPTMTNDFNEKYHKLKSAVHYPI